jgi:predicted acetyltransferase
MLEPSRAEIQLQPYMMARIVNLQAFLKVNGEPDFAAEIIDELIPENNIVIGKGRPEKMTIGEFTSRMMRNSSSILREYF